MQHNLLTKALSRSQCNLKGIRCLQSAAVITGNCDAFRRAKKLREQAELAHKNISATLKLYH